MQYGILQDAMTKADKNRMYELSRIFKGVANHRRIAVLYTLEKEPELSLTDITKKLNTGIKTTSEHIRKLMLAGLVMKRYDGNFVRHALTNRGKSILKFCRIVE